MYTVNGIRVKRGSVNIGYAMPVMQATWEWPVNREWDISNPVTIAINGTTMMKGTVKSVVRRRPEGIYEFMAEDILQRAVEYWFAPDDIDAGYTWSNIDHLSLTRALLSYASITAADIIDDWTPYPTFQFAIGPEPFKVTIAAVWDVINQINQITGMHVYADADNKVHLTRIWDEPGTPTKTFGTGNSGTMKTVEYYRSDENLRNRVSVYGWNGCHGVAQAVSPYVPAGFFKTAIISYDAIVDAAMAQETADINLARLNKLTESAIVEVIGDTSISCRQTATVVDSKSNLSGNWFIMQCEHRVDNTSGYTVRMSFTK
jgi:hypothetical protein